MTLDWFGQQLNAEALEAPPPCTVSFEPSLLRLTWADDTSTGPLLGTSYDQGVGLRFSPATRQLVGLELPVGGDLSLAMPDMTAGYPRPLPQCYGLKLAALRAVTMAGWNQATLTSDGERLFAGPLPSPAAQSLRISQQATLWLQGAHVTALELSSPYRWLAPGTGNPHIVRDALTATWRIWSTATDASRRGEDPPDSLLAQAAALRRSFSAQTGTEQLAEWLRWL